MRISNLSQNYNKVGNSQLNDTIAEELLERQKRSNIVVIFNLPEKNDDHNDAQQILHEVVKVRVPIIQSGRFGKRNRNGHRALKKTVENQEVATKIITASKNALNGKIFLLALT